MSGPKATTAHQYIEDQKQLICKLSDQIWELAEVGLHEERSAELLAEALAAEGFSVRLGVGGMPSGLEASWGSGGPVIGFLGEYDALPGVSQKAQPTKEELRPGGAGHACGHNLLGVGAFGAVIGLKRELEARGLPGTIKYFGCPAEENFGGKAFMARDGAFADSDACLTWHAGQLNTVREAASLAVTATNFHFKGRSAHAAGDPYNGRSALDAVQLMNLGVEFLREHMPPRGRMHYVITNGGGQPNVVPPEATVWYYVRAQRRDECDELYERVVKCANGAATMTETELHIELLDAIYELLPNRTLEGLLWQSMERLGGPPFDAADEAFANEVAKSFAPGQSEGALKAFFQGAPVPAELSSQVLHRTVVQAPVDKAEPRGSTDVGDVSWCCATAQFSTACQAIGTPGHSWQYTAQSGMSIGHKGMLLAAKVMAEAGLELLSDPELLGRAKSEFAERSGGQPYRCAMPDEHLPPFHQLAAEAAKGRA